MSFDIDDLQPADDFTNSIYDGPDCFNCKFTLFCFNQRALDFKGCDKWEQQEELPK